MFQRRFRFGISTTVDYSITMEKQIPAIKKAGFDFISIGADLTHSGFMDAERFGRYMDSARDLGLEITSIHLPFKEEYDLSAREKNGRRTAVANILHGLELITKYQIPIAIIHPHYYFEEPVEEAWLKGKESLQRILETKPSAVHLALENLPDHRGSWFCQKLMREFDASRIGLCYDSSHENMSGAPLHILEEFSDRITVTHLSDNHGQADEHLIPGDGNIDWKRVREILYSTENLTDLLFEVGTGDPLDIPLERFLEKAINRAREYFG